MFAVLLLWGCSEDLKTSACKALDGDTHFLTASAESGLQEAAAKFHIALHNHSVDIGENSWIWTSASGQEVTIYTDSSISLALHEGEEQAMSSEGANDSCSEDLPNTYTLTLTEGDWDFQLADSGTFSWIVAPLEEDDEHSHDHHDH